jgi:hypothetical protein
VSGQRSDELQQGSDRIPSRMPRWVTAAVVALVVAGGAVTVLRGDGDSPTEPAPSPTNTPTRVVPIEDPLTMISSSSGVCRETDHRRHLTVIFGVVNLSSESVIVRKVRPVTPLGGLRLIGQSIGIAACGEVQTNDGSRVLTAGRSLAVSFTFRLPKKCPAPLPVQAAVTVSRIGGARQVTDPIPVLSDLGGIEFEQC